MNNIEDPTNFILNNIFKKYQLDRWEVSPFENISPLRQANLQLLLEAVTGNNVFTKHQVIDVLKSLNEFGKQYKNAIVDDRWLGDHEFLLGQIIITHNNGGNLNRFVVGSSYSPDESLDPFYNMNDLLIAMLEGSIVSFDSPHATSIVGSSIYPTGMFANFLMNRLAIPE